MDKDGANIWKNTEFANALNSLLENKVNHIKMIKLFAELRREKYNALVKQGFSDEQALHIVTNSRILE